MADGRNPATQQLPERQTSDGISMSGDGVSTAGIEASGRGGRITPRTAELVLAKRPKAKKEVAIKHEYDADDSCDSLELQSNLAVIDKTLMKPSPTDRR